jgi:hypothetical protein
MLSRVLPISHVSIIADLICSGIAIFIT